MRSENTAAPRPRLSDTSSSQFLARFDVVTSEEAEKALLSTFATRPDFLDSVDLDGESASSRCL